MYINNIHAVINKYTMYNIQKITLTWCKLRRDENSIRYTDYNKIVLYYTLNNIIESAI